MTKSKISEGIKKIVISSQNIPKVKVKRNAPIKVKTQVASNLNHRAISEVFYRRREEQLMAEKIRQTQLSPSAQAILSRVMQIHNAGPIANARQQRIVRERRIVSDATNILKTRNLFGPESNNINLFDETDNPLKAENVFAAERSQNIMRTNRPSLLNTKEVY